jgi:hypothetical protein
MPIQQLGHKGGFASYNCDTPCEQIDYIAWQDMNELSSNIFPKIMDTTVTPDEDNQDISSEADDEDNNVTN